MEKPVYKVDCFTCPTCKSQDTVALDLDHGPGEPYDTIIWCACGIVTVFPKGAEPEAIFDFKS